jgi:CRISPR/Cas system-associated exonuclease Cas4 (RecB family)
MGIFHRFSYSQLSKFMNCPRQYRYSYVDRRVPVKRSDALTFGSAAHDVLEGYLLGGKAAALEVLIDLGERGAVDSLMFAQLGALVRTYDPSPITNDWVVEDTEVPFEIKVRPPGRRALHGLRMVGYVDAVLVHKAEPKRRAVLERKTTTHDIEGFSSWWQRKAIDPQAPLYCEAVGTNEIIYEVIKRPLLRVSATDRKVAREAGDDTAEGHLDAYENRVVETIEANRPAWHQVRPVPLMDFDFDVLHQQLIAWVTELRRAKRVSTWPMAPTGCSFCDYLEVCTGRAQLDDDAVFADKLDNRGGAK